MDLRDLAALRAHALRQFMPSSPEELAKVVPPMQQATPEQLRGPPQMDFSRFKASSPEELAKVVPPLVPWAPTLARK
jgi:hypothetical protein